MKDSLPTLQIFHTKMDLIMGNYLNIWPNKTFTFLILHLSASLWLLHWLIYLDWFSLSSSIKMVSET